MKEVEQRARPVCMSSFFFEQLAPPTAGDSTQGIVPTPAAIYPSCVTASEAISRELWDTMAPPSYRANVVRFLQDEHGRTEALKAELGETWRRVEQLMAHNKARREFLDEARLQAQLRDVESMCFWAAEDIPRHFNLDVSVGKEGGSHTSALKEARITLDFSLLTGNVSNEVTENPEVVKFGHADGSPTALVPPADGFDTSAFVPKTRSARRLSDKSLMNPSKRLHCLRRLFAPILQKRDKLPKHLTCFLTDLQQIQSNELSSIEANLQNNTLFNVPLHVPFQIIAQYITRDLTLPNTFEPMEDALVGQYDVVRGFADRLDEFLETASSNLSDIETLDGEERSAMACQLWDLLFKELEAHKEGHTLIQEGYAELTAAIKERNESLNTHLDSSTILARQAMKQLQVDAASCVEAIERTGSQTVTLVEKATSEFEKDLAALEESVRTKSFMLSKSEAAQEKMARRVREAVKDLYVEQSKYTRISQELLQDQLSLVQLQTSHKQLREAVATRYEKVTDTRQKGKELQEMLDAAEVVQESLLSACRQEIERQQNDAFYRRCRIVRYAVDNVQLWSRCVGDMAYVYEARYRALEDRSKAASWQVSYLLAAEKDWAMGNLMEVQPEMVEVQKKRLEVQDMANEVDIDMPSGTSTISKSSRRTDTPLGADQAHKVMVALDGPPRVNRVVPTLRKHKFDKNRLLAESLGAEPVPQALPVITGSIV